MGNIYEMFHLTGDKKIASKLSDFQAHLIVAESNKFKKIKKPFTSILKSLKLEVSPITK